MSDFDQDPDYTLDEWPPELLESELRRLIAQAQRKGVDAHWAEEVETLLRQAFSSGTPSQKFKNTLDGISPAYQGYGFDEEPF